MTHLFLGVSPEHMRASPYIPAVTHVPELMGYQTKLPINPAADVWIAPSVASYVGGDITAGVSRFRWKEGSSRCLSTSEPTGKLSSAIPIS